MHACVLILLSHVRYPALYCSTETKIISSYTFTNNLDPEVYPIVGAYMEGTSTSYRFRLHCKVTSISPYSVKQSNYVVLQSSPSLDYVLESMK